MCRQYDHSKFFFKINLFDKKLSLLVSIKIDFKMYPNEKMKITAVISIKLWMELLLRGNLFEQVVKNL